MICSTCGKDHGAFSPADPHSFATRRRLVKARRESQRVLEETTKLFPDLRDLAERLRVLRKPTP